MNSAVIIRPMGVGEVVDAGIRLARRNYRLLAMTTAWAVVPAFVLGAILDLAIRLPGLGSFVVGIGEWLAGLATLIACAHLVAPTGAINELKPGPLYRLGRGRLWRTFLLLLVVFVLAVPLTILFPLGIYLVIRWSQSWSAVVIEGDGPIQGMRRSWQLTRRVWWHTLGILLVLGVVYVFVSFVVGLLFGLVSALLLLSGSAALSGVIAIFSGAVSAIFVAPFAVATNVVLYYELRARAEGFDLGSRASQEWQAP